jgi:hypothetical protein
MAPPDEPRLLFDAMLARLARLVRAAGYDVLLAAEAEPDASIRRRAAADGRILVTRDRDLVRNAPHAVLLAADALEEQADALAGAVGLDWLHAPFTRCVVDNALLQSAGPEEKARMPPSVLDLPGAFNVCLACGRLYWPGSHVERLRERLAALQMRRPR